MLQGAFGRKIFRAAPLRKKSLVCEGPSGRKVLGVKGLRDTEKLCEGPVATSADVISGVLFLGEEQGLGLLSELTASFGKKSSPLPLPPLLFFLSLFSSLCV